MYKTPGSLEERTYRSLTRPRIALIVSIACVYRVAPTKKIKIEMQQINSIGDYLCFLLNLVSVPGMLAVIANFVAVS